MAKKRGKYSLNGVGTRIEQHAERVARLVKMNSPQADTHAYESLLLIKQRDPDRFKTLMAAPVVAKVYERLQTRQQVRQQARLAAFTHAQSQAPTERTGAVSAERRRRKLALNGEGTLSEQHIDRVTRLWSVLQERNHNLYQYRTRVAFADSMQWLEENEPKTFQTLIESLEDMSNGDDAYFIYIRHKLNQVEKEVAASNIKQDWEMPEMV